MDRLVEAIVNLEKEDVVEIVERDLNEGTDPLELIEVSKEGLEEVGIKFDEGEYYLIELMRAAEIFEEAAALINPKIEEMYGAGEVEGKVLLGTVYGDVHDLGKNILQTLLECNGFEVKDLGTENPPEKFIESIEEFRPDVVGMSGLLTASITEMAKTVEAIKESGLREDLKVVVGGGIIDESLIERIGADYATNNAHKGVNKIQEWVSENK